jgi:hypothetical protein
MQFNEITGGCSDDNIKRIIIAYFMGQNADPLNVTTDCTYIDQCYLNTEIIRI